MAPVAVVFTGEEAGGVVMAEVVLWQRRMLEDLLVIIMIFPF